MEVNIAPVCRYAFLLEKPVLYIRSVSLEENVVTNVKFLTISHDKAYNNYAVFLYGGDKNVNWEEVMADKFGFLNLCCNDTFFLANSELEGFLLHFGLK